MIWLGHLALHALGLTAAGALLLGGRWLWRRDPVNAYRFSVGLLCALLALPLAQWCVQGRAPQDWRWLPQSAGWMSNVGLPLHSKPPANEEARVLRAPTTEHAAAVMDNDGLRPRADRRDFAEHGPAQQSSGRRGAVFQNAVSEPTAVPQSPLRFPSWLTPQRTLAFYSAGAFFLLLLQVCRWWRTQRILRTATPVNSAAVLSTWQRVTGEEAARHPVHVLSVQHLHSPACCGLWRPKVLVPAHVVRHPDPATLEWALRHEWVHVTRGDSWVTLLQSLLKVVGWFHPVTWWLCREVDRTRELSCDHWVVEACGRRRSYAMALLDYAQRAPKGSCSALLHWTRNPSQLRRRIEMLCEWTPSSRKARLLRWTSLCALLGVLGAGQLGLAAVVLPSQESAKSKLGNEGAQAVNVRKAGAVQDLTKVRRPAPSASRLASPSEPSEPAFPSELALARSAEGQAQESTVMQEKIRRLEAIIAEQNAALRELKVALAQASDDKLRVASQADLQVAEAKRFQNQMLLEGLQRRDVDLALVQDEMQLRRQADEMAVVQERAQVETRAAIEAQLANRQAQLDQVRADLEARGDGLSKEDRLEVEAWMSAAKAEFDCAQAAFHEQRAAQELDTLHAELARAKKEMVQGMSLAQHEEQARMQQVLAEQQAVMEGQLRKYEYDRARYDRARHGEDAEPAPAKREAEPRQARSAADESATECPICHRCHCVVVPITIEIHDSKEAPVPAPQPNSAPRRSELN